MIDLATLQSDVGTWPTPALAVINGSVLGAVEFSDYFGNEAGRATVREGQLIPIPREQWKRLLLDEQFDAVLYLGPPSRMSTATLNAALCRDDAYLRLRQRRFEITNAKIQPEELRRACSGSPR